jgi:hypothetical protein
MAWWILKLAGIALVAGSLLLSIAGGLEPWFLLLLPFAIASVGALFLCPSLAWLPTALWLLAYLGIALLFMAFSSFGPVDPERSAALLGGLATAFGGAGCIIVVSVHERRLMKHPRPQTDVSAFE